MPTVSNLQGSFLVELWEIKNQLRPAKAAKLIKNYGKYNENV